jgi:hypothetical protein
MHKNNKKWRRLTDFPVGEDGARDLTVARFWLATEDDLPPEIFMLVLRREIVRGADGQDMGLRVVHHGVPREDAIPLSGFDVARLYEAIVKMKTTQLRWQAKWQREHREREERPSLLADLNRLLNKHEQPTEQQPEPKQPALDLSQLLSKIEPL